MDKSEVIFYMYAKRKAQTLTKFYGVPYDISQKFVNEIIQYVSENLSNQINKGEENDNR